MRYSQFSRGAARLSLVAAVLALAAGSAVAQLRAPSQDGRPSLRLPGGTSTPAAPGTQSEPTVPAAPTAPAVPAGTRELDRVVAVVNKDVITLRELERRASVATDQLRRQGLELPPRDVLLRQLLERMIVDRAQLQLAAEQGLRVDDQQLERALASIAQENSLTLAQMRQRIESEGRSYAAFREDIRGEIVRTRLREREVDSKVQVSEADIDAFLAAQGAQPGAAAVAVEYNVAHILLRVSDGATPEQIEHQRQRAEQLREQAAREGNFGRLAASSSDAPDALQGGQLGWRTADRLPELFAQSVAKLSPGELSPVLRSPAGFHLLQLTDRRDSTGSASRMPASAPVTQTHARHILIRLSEVVTEDEAFRRLREIRERVASGTADFGEMARQYSSDGSAGRGGDLGWIYPGDTVPEFERAMMALERGGLSEPVRTPFGVHLIQVLERRTDEASPERVRQQAREILRARRIDERYGDWLRQLRDSTYVEYKLDGN